MNCIRIYNFFYIFIFINGYLSRDIYVNINKDYFPTETSLKILNSYLDVRQCKDLRNDGNTVVLNISKALESSDCVRGNIFIHIFVYNTNIATALVSAKTGLSLKDSIVLLNHNFLSKKYIILKYGNLSYITFVQCERNITSCPYKGVDQKLQLLDNRLSPLFEVYSACTENLQSNCVTTIEFTSNLIDIDSTNEDPAIIGSEINIKPSYSNSQSTNLNCRNGGILIAANYNESARCQCPNTIDFIETGPQCEVLQMSLIETQYFYVLPNSGELIISFSIISDGNQGDTSVITILNKDNSLFLKYNIIQSTHNFQILNSNIISIKHPIDGSNEWTNILITIKFTEVIFQVNNQKEKVIREIPPNLLLLDTLPLITKTTTISNNKICLGYLKINSKIVDLYTPNYVNCRPTCPCDFTVEKCNFVPFKSLGNSYCTCNVGQMRYTNALSLCTKNNNMAGQLENGKSINIPISNLLFSYIEFRFRTLSVYGTLITLILQANLNYNISIGIMNGILISTVFGGQKTELLQITNQNINDGKWHSVNLKLTSYAIELTLDLSFSNKIIMESLLNKFTCNMIIIGSVNPSISSKSTCFDTISLVTVDNMQKVSVSVIFPTAGMTSQCDNGPQCPMLNCTENQNCEIKWQNSSCICRDNFVDQNGMCIFKKCVENPCKNGGSCSFDISNNNYKCRCINNYNGDNCDNIISSAGFQWWIILLVLLILLIILIVFLVYFCWYKKRKPPTKMADINKIHENTVCYNDQAGEVDYIGPPINYNFTKYQDNVDLSNLKDPVYPTNNLMDSKLKFDSNNNDLVLDHPLEYGFEGVNSEAGSVSSLGSRSTDEQLNIQPLDYSNNKFDYLKNIYK